MTLSLHLNKNFDEICYFFIETTGEPINPVETIEYPDGTKVNVYDPQDFPETATKVSPKNGRPYELTEKDDVSLLL